MMNQNSDIIALIAVYLMCLIREAQDPRGRMLTGLKRSAHIVIHLRRQWVFWTGLVLCIYSLITNGSQIVRSAHLNYQLAAVQCDGSCSYLCGLDASSFAPMNQGMVTTHHFLPRRPYLPTTITARHLQIRSHPNETWWLDPRRQPTFCQWGWPIDEGVELVIVSDESAGSPRRSRYWAEVPGKRLTTTPDSVITASFQPHVIYHYLGPFLRAGVLMIVGSLAHAVYRLAPYRYGTVRYILELERLVDTDTHHYQNVLFISLWVFMCLLFYIFAHLTGSSQSGVYLFTRSLVFLANGIGAYNLATEVTPITPEMVARCPEDLSLPLSWHTPTTLTLSQLFAVILVPYKGLRRAKERPEGLAELADHLDTWIIQNLSLHDLQKIRAMWAPHEKAPRMNNATVPEEPSGQPSINMIMSQRKPKPPPSRQGPRHPWLAPILRGVHLCVSLKEHWVVWLVMLSATHSLLGLAAPRLSGPAECRCTCQSPAGTPFQDCYTRAQANTVMWLEARSIVMYTLSVVFVLCIGIKLTIDYLQVRGVPYGTLEYILRLELNKRSLPNRMLYGFTSVCVLGVTTTCVIIAAVRVAQDGRSLVALLIYGLELLLQAIACFILSTEAGYLTPASLNDVPTIHLPMRCTQASDFVLAKLLRFTGLTEDEVKALPEHPEIIKKHRLSWLLGRHMAPADILAIQRFLRREGLGRFGVRRSHLKRLRVAKVFIAEDSSEEGDGVGDKGASVSEDCQDGGSPHPTGSARHIELSHTDEGYKFIV